MNFTLKDIYTVQKDCNYIEMIRRLKRIGVLNCRYELNTGIYTYIGNNNHTLTDTSDGLLFEPVSEPNPEDVYQAVLKIQEAAITFAEFCQKLAQAGVYIWEVNLELLHIEYKTKTGKILMREPIPSFAD